MGASASLSFLKTANGMEVLALIESPCCHWGDSCLFAYEEIFSSLFLNFAPFDLWFDSPEMCGFDCLLVRLGDLSPVPFRAPPVVLQFLNLLLALTWAGP